MITVLLESHKSDQVIAVVQELRKQGCVQGTDFEFEFKQGYYDYEESQHRAPGAIFTFYDDTWATMFQLRFVK